MSLYDDDDEAEGYTSPKPAMPAAGIDLGGILGSMGTGSGSSSSFSVPSSSAGLGDAVVQNAGLLGTIAVLSMLANNNGHRSLGQLVGRAGIDALNGLSAFGATRMQQEALQQQREATQADKDVLRRIQLSNLALKQQKALGVNPLADLLFPPQSGAGMAPQQGGMTPQGGATPMGGGMPSAGGGQMPQQAGQGNDPFAGVSSAQMPVIPSQYEAAVKQASATYGVPEQIIRAVMMQESGGNPYVVSNKGAVGLMQLDRRYHPKEALTDPTMNIMEGTKQLADYYKQFGTWTKALQAYNWGNGNMDSYLRTGRGLGEDANHKMVAGLGTPMPAETQKYVPGILGRLGLGGQIPMRAGAIPGLSPSLSPSTGTGLLPQLDDYRMNALLRAVAAGDKGAYRILTALREQGALNYNQQRQTQQDTDADRQHGFDNEAKLRGEFRNLTSGYMNMGMTLQDMLSNIQAANGAGDLAAIFRFMKALDPNSVVREGEQQMAQQTAGVPAYIANLANKWVKGERLSADQRKQFMQFARDAFANQAREYGQRRKDYGDLATKSGLDPARVLLSDPYATSLKDVDAYIATMSGKDAPVGNTPVTPGVTQPQAAASHQSQQKPSSGKSARDMSNAELERGLGL